MEIDGPGDPDPKVDRGAYAWLPGEPSWESVVEARLNHRISKYELSFEYSNDFGIDASIGSVPQSVSIPGQKKYALWPATDRAMPNGMPSAAICVAITVPSTVTVTGI